MINFPKSSQSIRHLLLCLSKLFDLETFLISLTSLPSPFISIRQFVPVNSLLGPHLLIKMTYLSSLIGHCSAVLAYDWSLEQSSGLLLVIVANFWPLIGHCRAALASDWLRYIMANTSLLVQDILVLSADLEI